MRTRVRAAAIVALAGATLLPLLLAVYANGLRQPFDSDCRFLTYQNRYVREPGGLPHLWASDYFHGAETHSGHTYESGYYRPLVNTLFWLEYRWAKDIEWRYNLDQLLLHWLSACFVAWFGFVLLSDVRPAVLAMFLFALHPINAFVAVQTKARADVLEATLYLATLLSVVSAGRASDRRSKWGWSLVVAITAAGAALTKESAVTLPVVAPAVLLLARRENRNFRRAAALGLLLAAEVATYAVVRWFVLGVRPHADIGYGPRYSALVLGANALKGFTIYLTRFLFPHGAAYAELSPSFVNFIDPTLHDPVIFASLALIIAMVALAARLVFQGYPEGYLIAFCLLTWSPLLAVRNIGGTLSFEQISTQERWFYLPAVGACLLVGSAAVAVWDRTSRRSHRTLLAAVALSVLAGLANMSAIHAVEGDSFRGLLRQYELLPEERLGRLERVNKRILHAQLISMRRGDFADAEARCREAVAMAPDSPNPAIALAMVLNAGKHWREAFDTLQPWIQPSPDFLARHRATNVRLADDLNRTSAQVAFVAARSLLGGGKTEMGLELLCVALEREYPRMEIAATLHDVARETAERKCKDAPHPDECRASATHPDIRTLLEPGRCASWTTLFAHN